MSNHTIDVIGFQQAYKTAKRKAEVISSVYGRCPICNAPGIIRERRMDGNDTCKNGHKYPSKDASIEEKEPDCHHPNCIKLHDRTECVDCGHSWEEKKQTLLDFYYKGQDIRRVSASEYEQVKKFSKYLEREDS